MTMLWHRYEPRFDGEGIGADKHFPKSPCIAGAWNKFEMMAVADKRTFAQEQARKLLCIDYDEDVKRESNGTAPNCAAVVGYCDNTEIRAMVRKFCPKTCGICTPGGLPFWAEWAYGAAFCGTIGRLLLALWSEILCVPTFRCFQVMTDTPQQRLHPRMTKSSIFRA